MKTKINVETIEQFLERSTIKEQCLTSLSDLYIYLLIMDLDDDILYL